MIAALHCDESVTASSSATEGSHCTSSGSAAPAGWSTAMTIAMVSSGIRPGMNGHVMRRPVLAAMCRALGQHDHEHESQVLVAQGTVGRGAAT